MSGRTRKNARCRQSWEVRDPIGSEVSRRKPQIRIPYTRADLDRNVSVPMQDLIKSSTILRMMQPWLKGPATGRMASLAMKRWVRRPRTGRANPRMVLLTVRATTLSFDPRPKGSTLGRSAASMRSAKAQRWSKCRCWRGLPTLTPKPAPSVNDLGVGTGASRRPAWTGARGPGRSPASPTSAQRSRPACS